MGDPITDTIEKIYDMGNFKQEYRKNSKGMTYFVMRPNFSEKTYFTKHFHIREFEGKYETYIDIYMLRSNANHDKQTFIAYSRIRARLCPLCKIYHFVFRKLKEPFKTMYHKCLDKTKQLQPLKNGYKNISKRARVARDVITYAQKLKTHII